ncbi:MAG: outer membrane lipoprotein carrier protein LolA [Candidatus Hydrogenedentota bacterium]|nr:MAG: outer membrane lipoprotein carrier protein LolA [Candidatus Hydrogenedentota bacterium]
MHHSDVVKKANAVFRSIDTYSANFKIKITEEKKTRTLSGKAYYKKGGKLNFTFYEPAGDKIISDGKTLWVYIAKLRAVGRQPYSKKSLAARASMEGVLNLFRYYHYNFDSPQQPRKTDVGNAYVLQLKEKTASGGLEKMLVYIDAKNYIIKKIQGIAAGGRKVEIRLSNIKLNPEIAPEKFEYKLRAGVKVVDNPLTTD